MILTNWYGGNYLLKTIKTNPIFRIQNSRDLLNDSINNFDISLVPEYARPFLSVSANYTESNFIDKNDNEFIHYSLGISNYAHLSSPMRRFIDMINHLKFYHINLDLDFNLNSINTQIKIKKKITNAWVLVKFIKSNPESNKFRACLFDWNQTNDSNKITGLFVLYQQEYKFISMVNVEIPQIDITINLTKYVQWDIELYYNSNNFKSSKFPFSIKIIQ
jgi:exoribonuclease R